MDGTTMPDARSGDDAEQQMTERKPPGMNFTSWIDQQISEAAERGAFENLPGAGKPLPPRPDNDDGTAWIRDKLQREGVSADELLPPPLKLRKERHRLIDSVPEMTSEQEVIDAARELNRRIAEWRRIPVGPPVHVPLADLDTLLASWREAHPVPPPVPGHAPASPSDARTERPARWRIRRRRSQ
jgi:hypothetical protein